MIGCMESSIIINEKVRSGLVRLDAMPPDPVMLMVMVPSPQDAQHVTNEVDKMQGKRVCSSAIGNTNYILTFLVSEFLLCPHKFKGYISLHSKVNINENEELTRREIIGSVLRGYRYIEYRVMESFLSSPMYEELCNRER